MNGRLRNKRKMREEGRMRFSRKDPLMVGDKVFLSANVWDLSEKELEKARIELGETEEIKQRCLQELKSKLSEDGDFRLDDEFLLRFLRVRKYDCEKAYLNVKNYYSIINKHSDWLGDPSTFATIRNYDFVRCLPYVEEQGRPIIWKDMGKWDTRKITFDEGMPAIAATIEIATMNPRFEVNGVIGIWDMKGLRTSHVVELLKKNRFLTYISLALFNIPWRINKLIIPNTGRLVRLLFNVVRHLMSKKISERVVLLGSDYKELHQYVDPAILPKELGGTLVDDQLQGPEYIVDNIPFLVYDRSFSGDLKS